MNQVVLLVEGLRRVRLVRLHASGQLQVGQLG